MKRDVVVILLALTVCFSVGLDCDFEGPCDWRKDDGFQVVSPLNISEDSTAPSVDADNNPEGHYLLYEVTRPGLELRAEIGSPWFTGGSQDDCALEVWLHMNNMAYGSIKILTRTVNVTWEVFHLDGNNKNMWQRGRYTIGKVVQPFHLSLEVIHPQTVVPSHLAIDNIRIIDCIAKPKATDCDMTHFKCSNEICIDRNQVCDISLDCPEGEDEQQDCDKLPRSAYCNFENGLCEWTNSISDDSEWTLTTGYNSRDRKEPIFDHTYGNASGHYIYADFPNSKKSKFGHRAALDSPIFDPPPAYHRNPKSAYFNSCQVHFFYHMNGEGEMRLLSNQLQPHHPKILTTEVMRVYGNRGNMWHRASIPLSNITYSYFLQFEASRGIRSVRYIAVDDVSLSPECFGIGVPENESFCCGDSEYNAVQISKDVGMQTRFRFSTCGNKGPLGPTSAQCSTAYFNSSTKVSLGSSSTLAGIQMWTVPEDGVYTIFARGAGGGQGLYNRGISRGSVTRATFNLSASETIYFLVGQPGENPCTSDAAPQLKAKCQNSITKRGINDLRVNMQPRDEGGGGGGGGATYVFTMDSSKNVKLLMVSGGGGGLSTNRNDDPMTAVDPNGKEMNLTLGSGNGLSSPDGAGGGGGWNGTSTSPSSGQSLLEGGKGGKTCSYARDWFTDGGFGGGGGACVSGGGGGGYRGGDAAEKDNPFNNGHGGTSYITAAAIMPLTEPGMNADEGSVDVFKATKGCGCQYLCVIMDIDRQTFHCICPSDQTLDSKGSSCIASSDVLQLDSLPVHHLVILLFCLLTAFAVIFIIISLAFNRYRKRQSREPRHEPISNADTQLIGLRPSAGGMVTSLNPIYVFGGSTCTIQDLRGIPRENLTLVKALGQGAFGEVYQGFLSSMPGEPSELAVGVKTLPEMSSMQAEVDFLMEALIMSKFNHSNIIRFIGVCFDKMPRFIVLELLDGGDLKSFLREYRPKPNYPPPLNMKDLLNLAMDVAKGCQYLEENHFIHRDIAARNCLLTTKVSGRVVKIADFGMARDIYRSDYYRKGGKAMLPVKWMPPEAFLDGIFTTKTDVWSFGVLLWEVMSLGYMPYPGRGNQEVMQLVTSGGRLEPPANCPGPVYHIMCQCWNSLSEERPNFTTIIERIGYCLQDPNVTSVPLPVFHRPPSTERDATLMRPPDSETNCLQVQRPERDIQSPTSEDYLIPMPSSNQSVSTIRTDLQSNSSIDSLNRLLELEENPLIPPRSGANGFSASLPQDTWETSFAHPPITFNPTTSTIVPKSSSHIKDKYTPFSTDNTPASFRKDARHRGSKVTPYQTWNQNGWLEPKDSMERVSSLHSLDALPIAPTINPKLNSAAAGGAVNKQPPDGHHSNLSLDATALSLQSSIKPLPYGSANKNDNIVCLEPSISSQGLLKDYGKNLRTISQRVEGGDRTKNC